jgi:hypothetical protein
MDPTEAAIVRRWLKEEGLTAEEVLNALVQTLTKRHLDCEVEKRGRAIPTRGGQPRRNALVATQDALHEFQHRNAQDEPKLAEMQKTLLALLTDCQFAAEKRAGLDTDDDNPPSHMRLVTD